MNKYRRRIENLERTIDETIRVIVMRDNEPDQVILIRKNAPPHQTYTRDIGENVAAFLNRSGRKPNDAKDFLKDLG